MRRWFHVSRLRLMMFALVLFVATVPWHARAVPGEENYGQQQAKLASVARIGDWLNNDEKVDSFLRDRDPVIAMATFHALRGHDTAAASRALLAVIDDTTEPTRLRALQLLVSGAGWNNPDALSALRAALDDPDPALVVYAVQTLAGRDDPAATSALTDGMREGSVATRLLIVRSVGTSDAAQRYLYDGLHDRDETVRSAAAALLFPSPTNPR